MESWGKPNKQHIIEACGFLLGRSTGRSPLANPERRPDLGQHNLFPMNWACNRSEGSQHNDGQGEKTGWPREGGVGGARLEVGTAGSAELNRDLTRETNLDSILQIVQSSREALESKIDTLTVDLTLLREDHRQLTDRVVTNEKSLEQLAPNCQKLTKNMSESTSRIKTLETRAEDAENRAPRSNLRLVGLPERAVAKNMEAFLERGCAAKWP
ncbi:hypothetical protein NDU88_005089 [Pleurodeles waltl]|uniref:Uncharacterized protein n=1 Tax=Pleurodeles waltl TaxID=8319 RepID=A0AAV7SKT0_PLEWA|nr:hypothetical protein NDU88_005089 [Pleurodeles waltl]